MSEPEWADFERLIEWIASTLHVGARVTRTPRLFSDGTGNTVIPDILIEYGAGGLTPPLRIIGEVRARKGPQDVDWVHAVIGRIQAAKASQAFLVSRDGFTAAARREARGAGIPVYTFTEATEARWSDMLVPLQMQVLSYSTGGDIDVVDAETGAVFAPSDASVRRRMAIRGSSPMRTDEITDAISPMARDWREIFVRGIEMAKGDLTFAGDSIEVAFTHDLQRPIRLRDRAGGNRRVRQVHARVRVSVTSTPEPVALMRFVDGEGAARAQVMETHITQGAGKYRLQLLIQGPDALIPANSQVSFRVEPLNEAAKEDYLGFSVEAFAESEPVSITDPLPITIKFSLSLKS